MSVTPANNATDVAAGTTLTLNFSEAVSAESGIITISETGGGVLEAITLLDGRVTGSGTSTISITLAATFASTTLYHVTVPGTAFMNAAGSYSVGISDPATWHFTTGNYTPPDVMGTNCRLDWIRDRAGHAGHPRMISLQDALTCVDRDRGAVCERDEDAALLREHEARDLWDMVEWLRCPLRGRERLIARRYFVEGATQREIGAELGVTDTRICQLMTERIRPVVEGRAAIYRAA